MNKISCELCGGTDIIKQDGNFVCQSCGAKYTVDEAKKMLSEDGVSPEVVGVDEELSLLYEKAHIMLEEKDYEQALNIYSQIVDKERKQQMRPNAESYFFAFFFSYIFCDVYKIEMLLDEVESLYRTFSRIFDDEVEQVRIEQIKFLNKYVIALSCSNIDKATAFFSYNEEEERLRKLGTYIKCISGTALFVYVWIMLVERYCRDKLKDGLVSLYANYIVFNAKYYYPEFPFDIIKYDGLEKDIIVTRRMLKYDPTYQPPLLKFRDGVTINLLDEINRKNTTEDSEGESSDDVDLSDERSHTEAIVSEVITDTSDENEKSFLVKLCLIVAVVIVLLAVCLPLIQTSPEKEEITPEPEPIKKEMVTKAVAPVKKEEVQKVEGIDLDFHEVIKLVIEEYENSTLIEPKPVHNKTGMKLLYKINELNEAEETVFDYIYGINIEVKEQTIDGYTFPTVSATSDHACYLRYGDLYFNNIEDYHAFTNKIHDWGLKKYNDISGDLFRIPIRKMTISETSVAYDDYFYKVAYREEGKQENGWYLVSFATQW